METWNSPLGHGFRLGDLIVRPDLCVIEKHGLQQRLEPKLMEVLLYLALRPNEVVRREQLIEDVWRTVVNDEALSRAISQLRAHLDDDVRVPRFIQTIPKSGYRLLVEPQPLETATAPSASPLTEPMQVVPGAGSWRGRWPAWVLALVLLAVLVGRVWLSPREAIVPRPVPAGYATLQEWFDALLAGERDPATITAVAVLPFEDLSEDAAKSYLGDSITDEVIQALSRVGGLKVVARRSTLALRDNPQDVRALGRYLGVDAILEGTVKRNEDRIRVTAQLSSTHDGFVLWSDDYDEPVGDVFRLQARFTGVVTQALGRISGAPLHLPAATGEPPDLDAYQLFLDGRYLLKLRGRAALLGAIGQLEKAIAIEPGFTRAKLELARATALRPYYDDVDEDAALQRAVQMLDALGTIGKTEQGEAESIRGFVADRRWQWSLAEDHHARALELNPTDPNAYVWYSQHLSMVGRKRDALAAAQRAYELDGVSAVVNDRLAITYLWLDDDLRAAEQFALGGELGFSHAVHPAYLILLNRVGRWDESKRLFALNLEASQLDAAWLDTLYPRLRDPTAAPALEACERAIAAGNLPLRVEFAIRVMLGDLDGAFDSLAKYRAARRSLDVEFVFARESRALRDHPRFAGFSREMGFTDYWTRFGPADEG